MLLGVLTPLVALLLVTSSAAADDYGILTCHPHETQEIRASLIVNQMAIMQLLNQLKLAPSASPSCPTTGEFYNLQENDSDRYVQSCSSEDTGKWVKNGAVGKLTVI